MVYLVILTRHNCSLRAQSMSSHCHSSSASTQASICCRYFRRTSCMGLMIFTQYWYWYPLSYFLSLALQPTALIGLNQELKLPKFQACLHFSPMMALIHPFQPKIASWRTLYSLKVHRRRAVLDPKVHISRGEYAIKCWHGYLPSCATNTPGELEYL